MPEDDDKLTERVWFMGPWREVGYYLRFSDESGKSENWRGTPYHCPPNFPYRSMDRNEWAACGKSQGTPAMDYPDGWSVMSVADYTIDKRPNVMAIFAVERPDVSKTDMKVIAWDRYPSVWKRLGVPTDDEENHARIEHLCRRLDAGDVPVEVTAHIREWAVNRYVTKEDS